MLLTDFSEVKNRNANFLLTGLHISTGYAEIGQQNHIMSQQVRLTTIISDASN
jgi:hypothetical protein